jgi:hypothetical protein
MAKRRARKSNYQFDFRRLKVKNHPDLLAFRWRATYHWKALDNGYNFALDLISIKEISQKNMGLQSCRSSNFGKFWDSQDKMTLGCWFNG